MNIEKGVMQQRPGFEEKRGSPRFKVECPATLLMEGKDGVLPVIVRELSATGLGISCSKEVEVGAVVKVAMTPEAEAVPALQMKAVVVRCVAQENGYHLGLKILQMMPGF